MNNIKYFISVIALSLIIVGTTSADAILFHAPYDRGFSAKTANGNPKGELSAEEINMETITTFLKQGIAGKALLTGILGEESNQKRLFCEYEAKDNISIKQGTVSFWVKPIDWRPNNNDFHVFFCAEEKDNWLIIYKFGNSEDLFFLFGPKKKDEHGQYQWTVARSSIKTWKPGKWSFVTCTWNDEFINLYIDGEFKNQEKIKIKPSASFTKFTVGDMVNSKWTNIKGTSLIDEIKIYDYPLDPAQVYAEWLKYQKKSPSINIQLTMARKTPKIDGKIDIGEYAFGGTGFFNLKKSITTTQSRYYISYDEENIYIATASPIIGEFYANIDKRDGQMWLDDSVELFLMPEPKSNKYYQFIFNSKGAFFDGKVQDSSWDAAQPLTISNKTRDNKWILEVAIPFAALGLITPQDGDSWKINICRSFPEMSIFTTISPVKKRYHDSSKFVQLTFNSNAPFIDLNSIGDLNNSKLDLNISASSQSKSDILRAEVQLESNNENIITIDKKLKLTNGNPDELKLKKDNFGDTGELAIRLSDQNDITMYQATFPFAKNKSPIKVRYFVTDIKEQILRTAIKHNSLIPAGKEISILVKLYDKDGDVVAETTVYPESLIYDIDLPIGEILPGDYEIVVSMVNNKEEILYERKQPFAKPSSPAIWEDNKIGITDKVPTPWVPLTIKDQTIECLGRNYSFNNTLFPSQITAQDQNLLASSIALLIDGVDITGNHSEIVFTDKSAHRTTFTAVEKRDNITITTKNLIEYDGFMWIDLDIETEKPVKINSLTLDIPLNNDCSTLVHSMNKGYLYKVKGSGKIPAKGWSKNLFKKPIFWVGNEDIGIQWFAENLKGWAVNDKSRSVEIIPQPDKTIIRLNIIDYPVTLQGKRSIAFGLMATPVKEKISNWRNIRLKKNVQPWFPYTKLFNYPDKNYVKDSTASKVNWHKKNNIKICYYHALYMISPYIPEWSYWSELWEKIPPPRESYADAHDSEWTGARVCLNPKSYRDFYIYKLAGAVKDLQIEDLYFDLAVPRECHNANHGCGWKDDKGKMHDTYNILGTRALAKRIYVMMKTEYPDSLIISHMSEEPAMPVLSFVDMMADGELYCKQVAEDKSYYTSFSPDWFRAEFMSRQWGPPIAFIPQFKRGSKLYNPDTEYFWDTPEAEKPLNHFTGYILVHDAKCWPNFGVSFKDVWEIQDQFGWDDKLKFIPYWDKMSPVVVSSPKSERIMASTYTRPGKAMIIVLNDTDNDEVIELNIDMAKTVPGKARITAKDGYSNENITIANNVIKISVPNREFRIIILE